MQTKELASLEGFLRVVSGANRVSVTGARPLAGGAIQQNLAVDVEFEGGTHSGRQGLVVRMDAPSAIPLSLTRSQEFHVLRAARAASVTVPEALWLCEDPRVLGRPFYLMQRMEGTTLGSRIVKDLALGGDRRSLIARLAVELARVHTVRPPHPQLDFLEMPVHQPALDAVLRYRRCLDDLGVSRPALEWGLRWCERFAPVTSEVVLIHQDFRTGNYMVDGDGLVSILDWEFAGWGDPMSDLGWFCARCWRFGRDELEAGGIGSREDFYRSYTDAAGRSIDEASVRYWEVMAHIRWAVIALQQGRRHTSGEEPSLELALIGRRPPELELEVLQMTAPGAWAGS